MTFTPLIAVPAYHLGPERVDRWPHGGFGIPALYVRALRRAGARPALLLPGEHGEPAEILQSFDGLMLVGGGDVDPARYGRRPGAHLYGVDPVRDSLEIDLLLAADRLNLPTLAICRGMQVMNVAFGGTLHQHLPDLKGLLAHGVPLDMDIARHDINVAPASRILATCGASILNVASNHHQGIERLGEGVTATAWSPDGQVEGIERIGENWMVGVEWHPEETAADDPSQQALFDGLANLARWFGSRARPGREARGREYEIVDHDPAWAALFEQEAARIHEALGDVAVSIEHIGSTSVPGLGAKPIVDIQVAVRSMEPRAACVDAMRAIGYEFEVDPEFVEHEFFRRRIGDGTAFHVHVCPAGSEWERRHPAFRDYLRTHPETAAEYERLKRDLAARHPRDIMSYVDGKTRFIRSIEARALGEASSPELRTATGDFGLDTE